MADQSYCIIVEEGPAFDPCQCQRAAATGCTLLHSMHRHCLNRAAAHVGNSGSVGINATGLLLQVSFGTATHGVNWCKSAAALIF